MKKYIEIGEFADDKIRCRDMLPELFTRLGYKTGVEVGVQRGYFSRHILANWAGNLTCVDPWKHFDGGEYVDIANLSQLEQDAIYSEAVDRLHIFNPRVSIVRETSLDAASMLKAYGDKVDFVYIDALHTYEGCKSDIEAWVDLINPGGMLCGHDYLNGNLPCGIFGVKRAVDEFAASRGLKVTTTIEQFPSWMIRV